MPEWGLDQTDRCRISPRRQAEHRSRDRKKGRETSRPSPSWTGAGLLHGREKPPREEGLYDLSFLVFILSIFARITAVQTTSSKARKNPTPMIRILGSPMPFNPMEKKAKKRHSKKMTASPMRRQFRIFFKRSSQLPFIESLLVEKCHFFGLQFHSTGKWGTIQSRRSTPVGTGPDAADMQGSGSAGSERTTA